MKAENTNPEGRNPENRTAENRTTENRTAENRTAENTHTRNTNTENFKVTGDWGKQKRQLQEKFGQLTDEDLKFESGREEELLKKVQTRLNKNRDEVINIIRKGQDTE